MKHRTLLQKCQAALFSIALCALALLNGCSTVSKDGPPPYDIDVSTIPNAQPKVEKLSKYGNMPVYRVDGKNYYVMNDSKHYQADGVASWYGTKFHKHNTSSGEKYDMLGMTAAHRTLPLPTYLQVTNKDNGKTVIVKVNDRGPFADNRLLDLSYAAAKKLGMIGHGTANVSIKAIDPQSFHPPEEINTNSFYIVRNTHHSDLSINNPPQVAENTSTRFNIEKTHTTFKAKQAAHYGKNTWHDKSNIYLQVGAFSNKSHAEKLKKQLSPIIASSIQITEQGGTKKLYRVQIGPIKNKTTVSQINKQLKSIGLSGKMLFV